MVPKGLRIWFVVHFVADLLFALPLFFAPEFTLKLFGWTTVDPFTTRLVAAALFGIGIESLLGRNAGLEGFLGMLNLKVIWSASALLGILWTQLTGGPVMGWAFLAVFGAFHILWLYYRVVVGRLVKSAAS